MSTLENFSAVLELAQERLPEGAYLAVANTLKKEMDKATPEIYNIITHTQYNKIVFEAYNKVKYTILMKKLEITMYRGPKPNDYKITATIQSTAEPVDLVMDREAFITFLGRIAETVGMCNIVREFYITEDGPCIFTDSFTRVKEFRKHMAKISQDDDYDDDDDDSDKPDWREYNMNYVMTNLLGLSTAY
jgi:hypothetical protein